MATNSVLVESKCRNHLVTQEYDDYDDDEKHVEQQEEEEDDEEQEEALSLCDLPVTLINHKDQDKSRKQNTQFGETEEHEEDDFDFNSWGGLFSEEPEMCVADEVFFQGQILPLRHSFSSEPYLFKIKGSQIQNDGINNQSKFKHFESSSEFMENVSTSEFGSNSNSSSRSCSLRSQNSSSSTSSSTTTTITPITRVSKPKIRNQFHTIPSPKPQLRQSRSVTRQNQGRKSSSAAATWEFFRLGVAPAPEMLGLQDLKFRNSSTSNRNCIRRNSSNNSKNSTASCLHTGTNYEPVRHYNSCNTKKLSFKNKIGGGGNKGNNHGLKEFVGKRGGLLSGCSCTVDSVVVQMDTVMIKSTNNTSTKIKTESVGAARTKHAMKEKVGVANLNKDQQKNKNKNMKKQNNSNDDIRQKQQGKKVMSRRRMFEWLKEVHAMRNREDEEALLSSNT